MTDATQLKGKKGLKRLVNAARYSMQGLSAAWRHEAAFREEAVLALVLVPVAFFLPVTTHEKALLVQATLLVPLVEILNSAIEAVVDRFGPEIHPLAGRAKDMASAAVLIALVIAGLVWLLVAGPVLLAVLG